MSPPTVSTFEYFFYEVPTSVSPGEQLTITVTVEDWVDDPVTKVVNVYVSSGGTPTPTPAPTPVVQAYPSIDIGTTVEAVVVDGKRNRLYLTNNYDDQVDIVDLGTRQITGNIPVGSGPWGADVTSDTARLYVANRLDKTISVIDLQSDFVVDTIDLSPVAPYTDDRPRRLAVGSSFAWVGIDDGSFGFLVRVDLDTGALSVQQDFGIFGYQDNSYIVASRDDQYVFACEYLYTPPQGVLLDGVAGTAIADRLFYSSFCDSVAISPDGSRIAYTNIGNYTDLLDSSLDYVGTAPIGNAPAFMPTNWNVLAGFSSSYSADYETVRYWDLQAGAQVRETSGIETFTGYERYESVADPQGGWLYVFGEGKLYFIDTGYLLPANPSFWSRLE